MSDNLEATNSSDIDSSNYEEVRLAMDTAVQAVVNSRALWVVQVQEAIQKAEAASLLADAQSVRASDLARALAEQARQAAAESTRLTREAKEAEATVQYHRSLLGNAV